jgi:DNA polymerase-3 subunit alpha
MAGYTLSEADLLRRAIGKKIPAEMEANRRKFIEGSISNGHKESVAASMYDMIEKFADYAFNKSHSIAYSILSFRTAYLKAHYPSDFYAACMSSYDDLERIRPFLVTAQREGMEILPPDVDLSENTFTAIDKKTILFGLSAIKGCGESAIRNVVETRQSSPFLGLLDFCHRVNSNTVRLNNVEALALAGAFDKLEPDMNRLEIIQYASDAVQALKKEQVLARRNQTSFFDKLFEKKDRGIVITRINIPVNTIQILEQEKEVLGFYVTGHPLSEFKLLKASRHFDEIASLEIPDLHVTVLGIIRNPLIRQSRKGSKFAFFEIEDETGVISCKLWGNVFGQFSDFLEDGKKVILYAKTNYYRNIELVVKSIVNAYVENNNLRFRYIVPELSLSLALFLGSLPAGPTPLDLEVPGYRYRLGSFSLSSSRSAKLASFGAYKETF